MTPFSPPTITAHHFASAPTLDDPRWAQTPETDLTLNRTQIESGAAIHEPGRFQLAYDNIAIYLRLSLIDHDLTATAQNDQDNLYQTGDVAEWFIGTPPPPPPDTPEASDTPEAPDVPANLAPPLPGDYLELHAAPHGVRSAYRILRPGQVLDFDPQSFQVRVAAHGTLNDPTDRDRGWDVLFTLPWTTLQRLDPGLAADQDLTGKLTLLVGRYNYGHHLPYRPDGAGRPELTMWPTQPKTAFHLRPLHAPLVFQAPGP
ncbi:MAG: hypothetical protein AAGG38_06200 [Planctomycetota bacterium]